MRAGEAGELVQRAARAQHAAAVRSAMTTLTPGVNAAVIWSAACSAAAASSWAGSVTMTDGTLHDLNAPVLLEPLERALSSLSWALAALALALVAARVF